MVDRRKDRETVGLRDSDVEMERKRKKGGRETDTRRGIDADSKREREPESWGRERRGERKNTTGRQRDTEIMCARGR